MAVLAVGFGGDLLGDFVADSVEEPHMNGFLADRSMINEARASREAHKK